MPSDTMATEAPTTKTSARDHIIIPKLGLRPQPPPPEEKYVGTGDPEGEGRNRDDTWQDATWAQSRAEKGKEKNSNFTLTPMDTSYERIYAAVHWLGDTGNWHSDPLTRFTGTMHATHK